LALAICGKAALPVTLQHYQPNAAVGATPHPWAPEMDRYHLRDILRLVIFYNNDFGINPGDTLVV
jgi:hypothetical protein